MGIETFPLDLRVVVEEVNEMLAARGRKEALVLEYPPEAPRHFVETREESGRW